jgi:hypothetical protein
MARVRPPPRRLDCPSYGHCSNSAERLLRVLGDARRQDARTGRFRRLPPLDGWREARLNEPFGTTENEAMEDLEDLELEDMKALGLRIEKCVDEVLRSHLVKRPLNTMTKNYVPKQKEWKGKSSPAP